MNGKPLAGRASGGRVPDSSTSFVGRELQLAESARLMYESWVVTLVCLAGSGKSLVAIEAVKRSDRLRWRSTAWVDQAPLTDGDLRSTVAAGAPLTSTKPHHSVVQELVSQLGSEDQRVAVRSCERMAVSCGELVRSLLGCGLNVKVLADSRVQLGGGSEVVWESPPQSEGRRFPSSRHALRLPATGDRTGHGPMIPSSS